MDLNDINNWPKLPGSNSLFNLSSRDVRQTLKGLGNPGELQKSINQIGQWNANIKQTLSTISKVSRSVTKVTSGLKGFEQSIKGGITSDTQLGDVKSTIKNIEKFQKNFSTFNKNINKSITQYTKAFNKLNSTSFSYPKNLSSSVDNMFKTYQGGIKKLNVWNQKLGTASVNLNNYKTSFQSSANSYGGLGKALSTGLISQAASQVVDMVGTALEQQGDHLRQRGEQSISQGRITEGLGDFKSGSGWKVAGSAIKGVLGGATQGAVIGSIVPGIGTMGGLVAGGAVGLVSGGVNAWKDWQEVGLKEKEAKYNLYRNHIGLVEDTTNYWKDVRLEDKVEKYRTRKKGSEKELYKIYVDNKDQYENGKALATEKLAMLDQYVKKYGENFEGAPVEELTEIHKLQQDIIKRNKAAERSKKYADTIDKELKAGNRFDTNMRIAEYGALTNDVLFNAMTKHTKFDVSSGHRMDVGYFAAEQKGLESEHNAISAELELAKLTGDGSEYSRTLIAQLEAKLKENEKKQYQSGYNRDEMRTRMHKMRHGFTLFERDAGVANLMNNQYATTEDYNSKISEIRGWNNAIDEEINKVLEWGESEQKLARLNELNAEKSGNVSTINKLMGANKSDMSNLLRGIVGSSALTDNLGSMSYWAGKTNPMGRLLENGNGLLQQILNVLKENAEQYSPKFQ